MGIVYLAGEPELDGLVALKVIRTVSEAVAAALATTVRVSAIPIGTPARSPRFRFHAKGDACPS